MSDACTSGGELDLSPSQVLQVPHAVFVFELSSNNVGPDEKLSVRVCSETRSLLNSVLIDDSQGTERLKLGIVVRSKGEGMERVQPAMISFAAI